MGNYAANISYLPVIPKTGWDSCSFPGRNLASSLWLSLKQQQNGGTKIPIQSGSLILLACLVLPLQAQKKGYSQGYIINLEGEIIDGWVKDRSPGPFLEMYKRVRFKPLDARIRKKLGPDQILGYGFLDQHYESVPVYEESAFFRFRYPLYEDADRVFLRVIASQDDLTYYHWEYVDDESSYLDYIPLFYRTGAHEMVRVTQGILGLKRERLMEYFRDCPELVRAIDNRELKKIDEVFYFYTERCSGEIVR